MRLLNSLAVLSLSAALTALSALAPASAQNWPNRPITMMVPFAAGSSSDVTGRVLAARMSEVLDSRSSSRTSAARGGMTGTARVARADPDGYTFVFASVDSMAIVPTMHKKPPTTA